MAFGSVNRGRPVLQVLGTSHDSLSRMSKPLRAQPLDSRGGSERDCQSWPKSPASSPIPGCREVAKMPAGITVVAVHIKVRYREQVIRELQDLRLPNLEISECEKEYEF